MVSEWGHSIGTGNIYKWASVTPWWGKKKSQRTKQLEHHVHTCVCVWEGNWRRQERDMNSQYSLEMKVLGISYTVTLFFFSSIMLYNESWWLLKPWWEEAVWNQDWEAVETKVWQLFYVAVPFSAKALSITPTHSTCSLRLTCQFLPALLVPSVCLWNSCLITCNVNHLFLPCLTAPWDRSAWGQGTK